MCLVNFIQYAFEKTRIHRKPGDGIIISHMLDKKKLCLFLYNPKFLVPSRQRHKYLYGTVGKAALGEHLVPLHEQHHFVVLHQTFDRSPALPTEQQQQNVTEDRWGVVGGGGGASPRQAFQ